MSKPKIDYLEYLKTKEGKWNWILIAVCLIAIGFLGRYLIVIGIIILIVILIIRYKAKQEEKNGKKI